jgi:NADPH-dependent 7-cyano-7-deazaguanine reductase QueF
MSLVLDAGGYLTLSVTGQPDFAHQVVDSVPGSWLLESKSLKLYLASLRNHCGFHEDCTVSIGNRIAELIKPRYIRIGGYWYPPRWHPDRGSCNPGSMMFFCLPM